MRFRRAARVTALLSVAVMMLTACGDATDDVAAPTDEEPADEAATTDDEEAAEDPAAEPDTEETVDEPEPVPEGVVEVPVWIAFTDTRLDWTRQVADAFNEQIDGYAITIEGYDAYEPLFDATLLAVDQGNPPAVVQYFEAATTEAADAVSATGEPLFTSVEAAIDGRDEILGVPIVIDDVVEAARNYYTLEDEMRSMAWNTSSAIMFNNMTMLQEYEVDIPETWDDVREACETIMSAGDPPDDCITWPNHSWFTEQTIAQQGELLGDNDNGRSDRATEVFLETDAMIDWLEYWKGLQDEGHYVYTGVQRDWTGTYNAFAAQQVPFLVYSSSDTTLLTDEGEEAGFEVQTSFMPYNADRAEGGNIIGGASLWLIDGLDPEVEDVALAFMNFLSDPENAADWHRETGYIPITNESVELLEDEGWFDESPNSRTANEQLEAAPDTPATAGVLMGNFVAIRDVITEAIEDILVNDLDPTERMADAQAAAQQLLDEYNSLVVGD
jgi:sn-glycerol 3-phosphate transport system substrate-binding protein